MASMAGRRALFWAVESLESRRLLCSYAHQLVWIDPANAGSGGISASLAHDDGHDDGDGDHHHDELPAHHSDDLGGGNDTAPIAGLTGSSSAAPAAVVAASALPGLPVLNSFPSASAAIYLDFNGDAGGQTAYD